ncbi:AtzE family amidohydrolase [Winogradskya consettensis]|uniref:Amidase n=1 Tax=Winogradskya consettensis TaxID=113560 RepID=A0A919T2W5_9ACTN|nr:amidase [Actinoplanes consettensis]GIM82290.1 amidase [Actinoplanes consettensis]
MTRLHRGPRPLSLARRDALLRSGRLDPAAYRRRLAAHIAGLEPAITAFVSAPAPDDDRVPGAPSYTVKDTIDVAGLPTGLGLRGGRPGTARHSAGIVAALSDRGWVCTGKVTTTECALGTVKPSRNPCYPHVSPAGSSTGSAVSVAAGFCDASVGSDSGGSLRWPAVYCGVTALRLTPRADLLRGVHAVAPSMESTGLITRTVADLTWLWRRHDLACVARSDVPAPDRIRFVVSLPGAESIHPEISALIARTLAALTAAGHHAERAGLPQVWQERGPAAELLAREAHDTFAALAGDPSAALGADTRAAIAHGAGIGDARYAELRERQDHAAQRLAALLSGPYDVLVMPLETGLPDPAVPAGPPPDTGALPPLGGSDGVSLTLIANFARLPVLALPLTLSSRRSPLGVQLLAAPGAEHVLLAAGALLEELGRKPHA